MYAITGITGQVGGALAQELLQAGLPVRAVLRDAGKAEAWAARGCDIALAEMSDAGALTKAFQGCEAVFVLPPPVFDPSPDFAEARASARAVREALVAARPGRVVHLSTIGARASQTNLLTQQGLFEQALEDLDMPLTVLRPGWFLENFRWDLETARSEGVLHAFLQPLDHAVPMVATRDIARVAAELLREPATGRRVVELEGPQRISQREAAAAFSRVLGREVRAQVVPRERWEAMFRAQGMVHPEPRMRMLDGFNEGWIAFEQTAGNVRRGSIGLEQVLRDMLA